MLTHSRVAAALAPALLALSLSACGAPASAALIPTATRTPGPTATPAATMALASSPTPAWTAIPDSPGSLREAAAARGLAIGAAVDTGYLFAEPRYMATLGGQFNMLTPETEMKFEALEPHQGRYDFAPADRLVDFAQANHMAVRGHVLVWQQAIPRWFADGDFSRDESIDLLHAYITTVVGHFRGRVAAWDVVNEAIYDNGLYRKSLWLDRIGPEYVEMAFRWAHDADPDALLFYNEYGIDTMNAKSNAVYALLKHLKSKGLPIDGVGLQMHIRADFPPPPDSVKANMERFGDLGLAVHITEMDVSTTYLRGAPDAQLEQQARVYGDVADTCLEVSACKALIVWGISDRHTWLHSFMGPDDRPLLFDDYYQPKPAYRALLDALTPVAWR